MRRAWSGEPASPRTIRRPDCALAIFSGQLQGIVFFISHALSGWRTESGSGFTPRRNLGREALAARGERSAQQRDEIAAFQCKLTHSITSSARASSSVGIAMPSALAVFALITRSNLTGSWIGRSPGFSPLKILST